MNWRLSYRCDPEGRRLADRHYNRQAIGAPNFVPPGACLVLVADGPALWVTSAPLAEYTHHAWAGAWVNSCFRREGGALASDLIREAVAVTRWWRPEVPALGLITFVDRAAIRPNRTPGRVYLRAGFRRAVCPTHPARVDDCAACRSETVGGLLAFQMLAEAMPEPMEPRGAPGVLPFPERVTTR